MYKLPSNQLDEMSKELSQAQQIVDKKNAKSNLEKNKSLEKLNKDFELQKGRLEQKRIKLEEKQTAAFLKLDRKYQDKKASIEYKAMYDSLSELFTKRKDNLNQRVDLLEQNYELAKKDIEDGFIGSNNYNRKVYIEKFEIKYSKKNFKETFNQEKENLNKELSKKEYRQELTNLKFEIYNEGDKKYAPFSIKVNNIWETQKVKFILNWMEFKVKWANARNWTFKEWLTVKIWSIPLYLLIPFAGVIATIIATNEVEANMIYAIAILLTISIVFGSIFAKIPIWNKYLGGALLGCMFIGSMAVYFGVFPKDGLVYKSVEAWFKNQDFLSLYISVLLVGAVLLIPKKMIIKATTGFFGIIIAGSLVATLLGFLSSLITGISFQTLILDYWLPILSDGNGGGIQPIGRIAEKNGYDGGEWMSRALAISTLASVMSVIFAALLNLLGKTKKSLSGDGQLIRQNLHTVEVKGKANHRDIAAAVLLILVVYLASDIIAKVILPESVIGILIPNFAWMIVICLALNLGSVIPANLKDGIEKTNKFISKQTTWLLMLGVGIIYINLNQFIGALNPTSLLVSLAFVIGTIIGTLIAAKALKFYGIEAAVSAGLCMTAQGGSGAIMVLGTSERMELMPWGQMTCRIAGSVILIFAGIAFSAWAITKPDEAPATFAVLM